MIYTELPITVRPQELADGIVKHSRSEVPYLIYVLLLSYFRNTTVNQGVFADQILQMIRDNEAETVVRDRREKLHGALTNHGEEIACNSSTE